MKSKVVVATGPRQLEIRQLPVPDDIGDGALLRVEGNGLCGSDADLYSGESEGIYFSYPVVPGHEIVGRIERISEAARQSWGVGEGDRVAVENAVRCGRCLNCQRGLTNNCASARHYGYGKLGVGKDLNGGLAEYLVLDPDSSVYPVAGDVSVEDAVLFNPLGNGLEWTLAAGRVEVGDVVVVFGAGQRGLCCVLAAREAGASEIIMTGLARDESKFELARAFGATRTVNVEKESLRDVLEDNSVDVAVDVAPMTPVTVTEAVDLLRPGGRLVIAATKVRPVPIPTDRVFMKALQIQGAVGGSPWSTRNALRIIGSGRYPLSQLHSHTFPLEETERAIQVLANEVPGESPLHLTIVP